jgi:hypothetical protein
LFNRIIPPIKKAAPKWQLSIKLKRAIMTELQLS